MLKNIPEIISPELIKCLMEMGHGDEILIADGNYPVFGQPDYVIRQDGHGISDILDAILPFFPLDSYVEHPVFYMDVLPEDSYVPEIWEEYAEILKKTENDVAIKKLHKKDFYEQGKQTYAVIKTSESALYANVILKKGVI